MPVRASARVLHVQHQGARAVDREAHLTRNVESQSTRLHLTAHFCKAALGSRVAATTRRTRPEKNLLDARNKGTPAWPALAPFHSWSPPRRSAFLAVLCAFTVQADEALRTESQEAVANFLKTDSTLQRF